MNVFQCLIHADPIQHKENATGEENLLQLPLLFNLGWILSHARCHFAFTPPPHMRSEAQCLASILDEKVRKNWTSNINILRSSSVRSRKEEPFPGKGCLCLSGSSTSSSSSSSLGLRLRPRSPQAVLLTFNTHSSLLVIVWQHTENFWWALAKMCPDSSPGSQQALHQPKRHYQQKNRWGPHVKKIRWPTPVLKCPTSDWIRSKLLGLT